MGLNHVLDFTAYDHILFLIVLALVFNFNQWKKALWLVTLFTIGHSITLALSAYKVISVNGDLVEFLIPVTILITGLVNILTSKNKNNSKGNLNLMFAVFFGFIHGLGFSSYFKMMIGNEQYKALPLLEFAIGIEVAQIVIVVAILLINTIVINFFKVTKRDWVLVWSSIVMGFAIKMILERVFW